jgi:hypothetical protein
VRQLVYPVGISCDRVLVGRLGDGAIPIDRALRETIDAPEEIIVHPRAAANSDRRDGSGKSNVQVSVLKNLSKSPGDH